MFLRRRIIIVFLCLIYRVGKSVTSYKHDAILNELGSVPNDRGWGYGLYSSPSIIRMIKSRRMRWAGHVARMGENTKAYRILAGKPEGKRPLENQDVGGWTILKWILER
jgi:hypothetical protein